MVVAPRSVPTDQAAPPAAPGERGYYSISQAAALLGVSRISIWRWIRAGKLPAARLGHRTSRIKREDLESFLSRRTSSDSGLLSIRDPGTGLGAATGASKHIVQFYETDPFLLDAVAEFIGAGLRAGEAGLVIATEPHREALEECLMADGLDLVAARADGRFVSRDAAETLATFMVDDAPDPGRFRELVGDIVGRAIEGRPRARIFGEMVALLVAERNLTGAIRLEQLWNDLQKSHPFSLFCAYPIDGLGGVALADLVDNVCAEHSRVVPAESYTALLDPDDRPRAIARLQQKARSLEAEIAERKRMEQALRSAVRARDEFLAIASHELRTPLTTVAAHAQLMLRRMARDASVEPAAAERALRAISDQAGKLSRLVEQLLDVSRLEDGKFVLDPRVTDLRELVERVTSAAAVRATQPIAVRAPDPILAMVDPLRLDQALTNLLDNAIKYGAADEPIDVELTSRAVGWVEIAVRDRGPGIPESLRADLFERFFQARPDGYKSGMGLGLYITRQIAERHGGEIRAEFPPDSGTRFVIRLPTGSPDPR